MIEIKGGKINKTKRLCKLWKVNKTCHQIKTDRKGVRRVKTVVSKTECVCVYQISACEHCFRIFQDHLEIAKVAKIRKGKFCRASGSKEGKRRPAEVMGITMAIGGCMNTRITSSTLCGPREAIRGSWMP